MEMQELPLGFGLALAGNEAAMERYATMSEAEKQAVLKRTREVRSKDEMRRLVSGLAEGG